jgi:hypothetical protein
MAKNTNNSGDMDDELEALRGSLAQSTVKKESVNPPTKTNVVNEEDDELEALRASLAQSTVKKEHVKHIAKTSVVNEEDDELEALRASLAQSTVKKEPVKPPITKTSVVNEGDDELEALRASLAQSTVKKEPVKTAAKAKEVKEDDDGGLQALRESLALGVSKKAAPVYDEKALMLALSNCKQLDESVIDKISEDGIKSLMACQQKTYSDLLLNPLSLDFSWQKKPSVKQLDTLYTFEDVIGRPACVSDKYPFPELTDADFRDPSNRGAHSIYLKPDTNEREYPEVMLKCQKDEKGMSPEEYLKEQEEIIRNLKMIIEDLMKDSVMAIDYKKSRLRMENPQTQAKVTKEEIDNPRLVVAPKAFPEHTQELEYKAALDEYRKRNSIRTESLEAFESNSNLYFTAYKRKNEIFSEMTRLNEDITRLNGLVKGGLALKTPTFAEIKELIIGKAKRFFSSVPTNEELLESSKAALKEYQSEMYELNKEIDEYKVEVRVGLNTIPLDTKLDVELLKAIYSLNKEAFLLPEVEKPVEETAKTKKGVSPVDAKTGTDGKATTDAKTGTDGKAATDGKEEAKTPATDAKAVEGKKKPEVAPVEEKKVEPEKKMSLRSADKKAATEEKSAKSPKKGGSSDKRSVSPKKGDDPKGKDKGVSPPVSPKSGKSAKEEPVAVVEPPIPYDKITLKPMNSRALNKEEVAALKDISDDKYSIYESTYLENEMYGVKQVNKFITEVNKTFSSFKRTALNNIILQSLDKEVTEKKLKLANSNHDIEKTLALHDLNASIESKNKMERDIKAGKNVGSSDEEMYSYVLSSLLAVPESMTLDGLTEGQESVLKGATIESKLAVPDMQGFIKLINM